MSQLMHTSNYGSSDAGSAIDVNAVILTTAQVAAATAEQKNAFGTLFLVSATGLPPYSIYLATGTALAQLTGSVYTPSAVAITGGTINGTTIGATTRSTLAGTTLAITGSDTSGTPGAVTNNSASGRHAIAAAASSVVVTNATVAAADHVFITPRQLDATATQFFVTVATGSFTVTTNAAATANWAFDFLVIKN